VVKIAKKARVYDGTAWQELASAQTDLTAYSTTAQMNTAIGSAQSLVLLATSSPSSASSVTISNCFSTTYDRYLVMFSLTSTAAVAIRAQMTLAGTANTENLYFSGNTYITHASGPSRAYNGSVDYMNVASISDLSSSGFFTISNAALAKPTTGTYVYSYWGTVANETGQGGFSHNKSVAYDGIKLYPSSSTMSGEIRIYGYKN
jgi:hypothetical protein